MPKSVEKLNSRNIISKAIFVLGVILGSICGNVYAAENSHAVTKGQSTGEPDNGISIAELTPEEYRQLVETAEASEYQWIENPIATISATTCSSWLHRHLFTYTCATSRYCRRSRQY